MVGLPLYVYVVNLNNVCLGYCCNDMSCIITFWNLKYSYVTMTLFLIEDFEHFELVITFGFGGINYGLKENP